MRLRLNRELYPIKNGWCSRSPALRLAAHGYSPEVADKNLERTVRLLLAPSQREGVLAAGVAALGLEVDDPEGPEHVEIVFGGEHAHLAERSTDDQAAES